jgi:hypothetical protein
MGGTAEQALQRAIATISQSDPLIKLLQQVRLGRMLPGDAGLRAITESWLGTYEKAVGADGLTISALRRLDPAPRIGVLIESGVLTNDHPAVVSLKSTFERAMQHATE